MKWSRRASWSSLVALPILAASIAMIALAQPRLAIPEQRCPQVRIDLVPLAQGRGMSLRVTNVDPGDFTARLQREVHVEQEIGGRWQRVGTSGFYVRERCTDSAPTDCVVLARRSSITVAPWDGMLGDTQCDCLRCAPAPQGRYRFVVESCGCQHPRTTYSAPFDLGTP